MDIDEPAVLVLADSWSGHSKKSQQEDLMRMKIKMLQIPPRTTDKLQPLDVNFNRQLKIFYNRIMEEAFYEDIMHNVTSREGIINIQSLMHNQLSSPKYRDMILYAWHNTDPAFNRSSLVNFPPKMVNSIQFDFEASEKCQVNGCEKHPFIKCAHCDQLLCLHHFLERKCFHNPSDVRKKREAEPEHEDDESGEVEETANDGQVEPSEDSRRIAAQPKLDAVTGLTSAIMGTAELASGLATIIASHKVSALNAQLNNGDQRDREHYQDSLGLSDLFDSSTPASSKTTRKPKRKKPSRKKLGKGRLRLPSRSFGRG